MQLTLFEFLSQRFHLQLSNRMSIANPISKFVSAPKPWAASTHSHATTLSAFRILYSMNFCPISLPASARIFSTILPMKVQMMTPIIPTLIYLFSIPMIQPISFKLSKATFVQFQYQRTSKRHRH